MKRFWRVLEFVGVGFAVVAAFLLIWFAIVYARANARLERKLSELRADNQPLSLIELAREPIPPETNAATYLRRAESDLKAIEKEVTAAIETAPQADQDAFHEGHTSPAIVDAIRSAMAAYPDVYTLLDQASQCPDFDPQFDFGVRPEGFLDELSLQVGQSRTAIRFLSYRVRALLADGKNDEALDTCLVMFRLCRHFDRNPMINSYLVALAARGVAVDSTNRVLRAGPLPDAAYRELEEELAKHDVVAAHRQALSSERAFGVQSFRELLAGNLGVRVFPPMFKNDQSDYLELIELLIETTDRPYSDSNARSQGNTTVARSGPLTQAFAPATQAMFEYKCRVQAQLRCLRILNAILRRAQAGDQTEPKLTALGLPADVLEDPYSGESLLVKKLPDGWVIYSVGRKLTDGGGTNVSGLPDQDVGVGPLRTVETADADK